MLATEGFTLWRSAATGSPWWRAVKVGEATTYEEAAAKALELSRKHGEVRALPNGETPAAKDNPNARGGVAWIVAHSGATCWLQHGPSAARLLARAMGAR